jgi:ubiquinone/menaquinone biosynthesis C-methylase UbiE
MPLSFHNDTDRYFNIQHEDAKSSIIPFIKRSKNIEGKRVAELGCGEAGILKAFEEVGCKCYGLDLDENKISYAKEKYEKSEKVSVEVGNALNLKNKFNGKSKFDIVILKDTIEHIKDKVGLLGAAKSILKEDGAIFIGFPPWQMPYGGHQQITESKLGKIPFYHLLPDNIYKSYLEKIGEKNEKIEHLMEISKTGLSISKFEDITKESGLIISDKKYYIINPIYEYKFGLHPVEQFSFLYNVPWVRNFLTTTAFYLLEFRR